MPHTFVHRLALVIFLVLLSLQPTVASVTEGWKQLYDNKPLEARKTFEKALTQGTPQEKASAHRGMATVKDFLGENDGIHSHILKAYQFDKDQHHLAANVHYLYQWSMVNNGVKDKTTYKLINKIIKNRSLFTGLIQDALLYRYLNDGNIKKAGKLHSTMGFVSQWNCIGPFDNISNAGFEKSYAPEHEIDLQKTYTGKDGNKTSWRKVENNSSFGWIFLKDHSKAFNSIHYFYTTIESEKDQKGLLSLGASGSYKLFLNGKEILRDSLFRNTGIDAFMKEVTFNKGKNALLLKIGQENEGRGSGEAQANFCIRILNKNYAPLGGIKSNTTKVLAEAVDNSSRGTLETPLLNSVKSTLMKRIEDNPNDLDALTSIVKMTNFLEMGRESELLISGKLKEYPNSSILHGYYAETAMRSRKMTEYELSIKKAYENCELNWSAWQSALDERLAETNPERVLQFLEKSPEIFKERPMVLATYIMIYSYQARKSEVLRLIDKLEKLPNKNQETIALLSQYYISSGRVSEGVSMVKNLLAQNRMVDELYSGLSMTQMELGSIDDAMATYRMLEEIKPLSPRPNYLISLILMNQKKLPQAKAEIEKALKKYPHSSTYLNLYANILAAMKERHKAKEVFQRIIDYTSSDFLAYESIRTLEDKKSFDEMTPLPKVDSLVEASKEWCKKQEAASLVSYIQDIYYYPSHAKRSRNFEIIHLNNQEAVEELKERRIYFNPTYQTFNIDKAYSLKADGTEIKADQSQNFLVYKSLEPGDYIVLEYSLFDYYQGDMAGKTYGTSHFEPPFPAYSIQTRMVTPKNDTIPYTIVGDHIQTAVEESGEYAIRSFTTSVKKEGKDNEFSPSDHKDKAKVVYSNFSSWKEINQWYRDLSAHKQQETTQLRAVADSLFTGTLSPREKVKKVYDYIGKNITYSSVPFRQSGWVPQHAQDVLMTKIGDCKDMSSLGKALLNMGEVESYLVLENGNQRYFFDHSYIGPNFNHCILGFKVDDSLEYIDFTDKATTFGAIPRYIQGTMALVIDSSSDTLIQLPVDTPKDRIKHRQVAVTINSDLSLDRKVQTTRVGSFADDFRRYYRFANKSEREKEMKEVLSREYSDLELKEFKLPDLSVNSDSLIYSVDFTAKNVITQSGDLAIYTVSMPDKIRPGSFPIDTLGTTPVDMGYSSLSIGTFTSETQITIPKGWKLRTVPKPITLKTDNLSYSLQITPQKDKTIKITRNLITNYNRIFSPEEFKEEIVALKKASQADKVQLLFKTE